MKLLFVLLQALIVLLFALLQISCSDSGTGPQVRHLDFLLKYGVQARNELNTFDDTFTKDLILDGTITTRLVLTPSEFDSIQSHLLAIDVFSYPDTFSVSTGDTVVSITPYQTYILSARTDSGWKHVYWEDAILSSDERATRLRKVFDYIRELVQSKPEYKQLPRARGGYS